EVVGQPEGHCACRTRRNDGACASPCGVERQAVQGQGKPPQACGACGLLRLAQDWGLPCVTKTAPPAAGVSRANGVAAPPALPPYACRTIHRTRRGENRTESNRGRP